MLDVEFKREQDVRKLASRVANNKIKIIAGLIPNGKPRVHRGKFRDQGFFQTRRDYLRGTI